MWRLYTCTKPHKKSKPSAYSIFRRSGKCMRNIKHGRNKITIFLMRIFSFFFFFGLKKWCADFEGNAALLKNLIYFFGHIFTFFYTTCSFTVFSWDIRKIFKKRSENDLFSPSPNPKTEKKKNPVNQLIKKILAQVSIIFWEGFISRALH